jgi:C4-dicarboxylate transporter DctM subunit
MLITLVLALAAFIAVGMPIAFSMGFAAVVALLIDGSVPMIVLPQKMYSSLDSFPLLAIPLFILAGAVMNVGGITGSLIGLARVLVGHLRGGLGHVTVMTNVLFATISGSAAASAAAVGSMLIPEMAKDGYAREDAAVINAAAAILGPIIPPSLVMVIYGAMTGLSIGTLLIAGIGPGLLIALILMIAIHFMSRGGHLRVYPRATLRQAGTALKDAVPALIMPVIIVGGILSGLFTATEAGVIAVAYGIVYALASGRSTQGGLARDVADAAIVSSSIMIILGGASLFGWIVAREGVPALIAAWLQRMTSDPIIVMILILGVLLAVGVFIEPIPAMVMLVPVLQPVSEAYGFDPIHFAMVVTFGLLLGSLTPPVAVLVLITCKIAKVDVNKANKPLIPIFLAMLAALVLIAFVPWISLVVPRLVQ